MKVSTFLYIEAALIGLLTLLGFTQMILSWF
jgi:hypothetical protein